MNEKPGDRIEIDKIIYIVKPSVLGEFCCFNCDIVKTCRDGEGPFGINCHGGLEKLNFKNIFNGVGKNGNRTES